MGGMVLLIGRLVFSFFFIYSGFNHLTKLGMYSQYAGASGVPAPTLATAVSGLMLLAGGASILLGVLHSFTLIASAYGLGPDALSAYCDYAIQLQFPGEGDDTLGDQMFPDGNSTFARLMVKTLIPAAFTVHKFWGISDPMMAANQAAHFWKNISLAGACLLIYGFAVLYPIRWPYSLGR